MLREPVLGPFVLNHSYGGPGPGSASGGQGGAEPDCYAVEDFIKKPTNP